MKITLRFVGLLLFVGALVSLLVYWVAAARAVTNDAYVTGRLHAVAPRVTGTVTRLHVDDNQQVRQGDILIELDTPDFQVRVDEANAQVQRARGGLASAQADVAQAKAAQVTSAANTFKATADFTRAQALVNEIPRGVSRQDYDAARATLDAARAAQMSARARIEAAEAGVRTAQAQTDVATAQAKDAALALSYTRVAAPVSGYIGRRQVEVGARLNAGQTVLSIVSDEVWVVANFKETQLAHVGVGAPAELAIDALPGVLLHGRVQSLSPASGTQFALLPPDNATGNFTKVVQRVPVKITFEAAELARHRARLTPGLSVVVKLTDAPASEPSR